MTVGINNPEAKKSAANAADSRYTAEQLETLAKEGKLQGFGGTPLPSTPENVLNQGYKANYWQPVMSITVITKRADEAEPRVLVSVRGATNPTLNGIGGPLTRRPDNADIYNALYTGEQALHYEPTQARTVTLDKPAVVGNLAPNPQDLNGGSGMATLVREAFNKKYNISDVTGMNGKVSAGPLTFGFVKVEDGPPAKFEPIAMQSVVVVIDEKAMDSFKADGKNYTAAGWMKLSDYLVQARKPASEQNLASGLPEIDAAKLSGVSLGGLAVPASVEILKDSILLNKHCDGRLGIPKAVEEIKRDGVKLEWREGHEAPGTLGTTAPSYAVQRSKAAGHTTA